MNTMMIRCAAGAGLLAAFIAVAAGQTSVTTPVPPAAAVEEHEIETGDGASPVRNVTVIHGDFNGDGLEDQADWTKESVTIWSADNEGTYDRQDYFNLTDQEAKTWLARLTAASTSHTMAPPAAASNIEGSRDADKLACRGTNVGQVNGTPSGSRGETVTVVAGLSQETGLGLATALSGWVNAYVASGSTWRYLTRSYASGIEGNGFLNSYAAARFRLKIAATANPGRYIRLQYRFDAQNGYCSSLGYGSIYVRP